MGLWPRPQAAISPHEDYGFFGPGSVTWKVWSYPTSLTVGFQRAVVIEELDPALVASVDATRAIWDRPRSRYDRTIRYFAGFVEDTLRLSNLTAQIGLRYDHANFPKLRFAENDATELGAFLRTAGYEVTVLTSRQGRLPNVRTDLSKLLAGRKRSDLVLVGFAGADSSFDPPTGQPRRRASRHFR